MRKMSLIILLILAILAGLFFFWPYKKTEVIYGVSFDREFAGYLGLDWQKTYAKILDEWGFRYLRLSAHWSEVEKEKDKFNFAELDWLVKEAEKRQAKVILALGQKTPRWPECHVPEWASGLEETVYRARLENYLQTVVKRYKDSRVIEYWQVENEPFLPFGHKCGNITSENLQEEITIVKNLDPVRPIIITDSGELSTWRKTAKVGNFFGTTVYRVVWNKWLGYTTYNWLPPTYFRLRFLLNGRAASEAYVMELQAEPWIPNTHLVETPLEEQYKSMSVGQLNKNLDFTARLGMKRAYLWGAEWWVWLEEKGVKEFSELVKTLRKE